LAKKCESSILSVTSNGAIKTQGKKGKDFILVEESGNPNSCDKHMQIGV
jgi:hypothetical protein